MYVKNCYKLPELNYHYVISIVYNISQFLSRRSNKFVYKDQPELLQTASKRGSEESGAQQLYSRSRILPVLQATTLQTIQSSQIAVRCSVIGKQQFL